MSNRLDYYFRQRVTEAELDLGFAELEQADQNLAADLGFTGVLAGAAVSQHAPVADLTVDVSGPGAILDQLGQRIFFSALQNVSVANDDAGVSTEVSAAGKEKVVSVFAKFDRALSDPRVDGNSLTVFFRRDESFKFIVAQGAEAPAGTALPPPFRSDAILLVDVTRRFAQSQVLAADVSVARRQDAFVLAGASRSIRRGRTIEALSDLLGYFNAHVSGLGDRHPAAAIDYAGGGSWADGTTNPAATVEAQFDKLVSDLAAASGAPKLGAAATAGSPNALAGGTVKSQLDALLGFLNAHINQASGAHAAAAISYAGGANWKDGTTNPAATVEAQLDKLVGDLIADAGASRIGVAARTAWLGGRANPTGVSIFAAIDKVITDLAVAAAADDGARRIGAQASGNLPEGSVRSQLDALDVTSVRTSVANVFSAAQTLNGAAGDTDAALVTTTAPTTRKLLWDIAASGSYNIRLYSAVRTFEVTLNARWNGAQWVKDSTPLTSLKFEINNFEFRVRCDDATLSPFADTAWSSQVAFGVQNHGSQFFDAGGNWISAGSTETYVAWQGQSPPSSNTNVGAGASFQKTFPATPSSFTFTVFDSINLSLGPFAFQSIASGTGAFINVTTANANTRFYARIVVA